MILPTRNAKLSFVLVGIIALILMAIVPLSQTSAQDNLVIRLAIPNFWDDIITEDVLAQFTAQTGVGVEVELTPGGLFIVGDGSLDSRLAEAEALTQSADVVFVDSSDLQVEATQAGYFLDLAPLVNSDTTLNTSDFFPIVWASYQWNGGIWALPVATDVILMTYDPVAFDQAGIAYPNERWTIDDFNNAARQLTQYNADGTVAVPGMTTASGGDSTDVFLRSLLTTGLYDVNSFPNTPQFADASLESILSVWNTMQQDRVAVTFSGLLEFDIEAIPLRIEGRFGYAQGFNDDTIRLASFLPNNTAGLNVQGFAISSGTQYPEQAYALAKFLTTLPEIGTSFTSVMPARQSLVGQTDQNGGNQGGGPGGGGRGGGTIPADIQAIIPQAVAVGLPVSELRYASYLVDASNEMLNNGVDALTALQNAEAQAIADTQTSTGLQGTLTIAVATPLPPVQLAAGEIELSFAVNSGFGGGPGGGGQLPNETEWRRIAGDFSASNPAIGNVILEATQSTDLATLASEYECFVLSSNVVPGNDLSSLLNLDPLIDTDPNFDRNDVLGTTLAQVQQDNRTWALPISIQPQMLSYNPESFALAGVPEPVSGWTIDSFIDALQRLQPLMEAEQFAFAPNDPTGAYIMLLIGAFGGLPIDYGTTPPTLNFTDANTIAAITQVLDLAKNGFIDYDGLAEIGGRRVIVFDTASAISTNVLNQFQGQFGGDNPQSAVTFYPSGTQNNVIAYEITTGYISANAQNPEACYQWLSTLARNPQLFSGMPARASLLNDPALQATQNPAHVNIYQQFQSIFQAPNTVVLPVAGFGGDGASNLVGEYWIKRAFDHYVLEDANLEVELVEAQSFTEAYYGCAATVSTDNTGGGGGGQQALQQLNDCATNIDPTFSLFGN